MKSDVVVLGCSRFMGVNLCGYLIQHTNFNVTGIDSITDFGMKAMQPVVHSKSRFSFYPIDITTKNNYLFDGSAYLSSLFQQIAPKYAIIDAEGMRLSKDCLEQILFVLASSGTEKIVILMGDDCSLELPDISEFTKEDSTSKIYALKLPNVFGSRSGANNSFLSVCKDVMLASAMGSDLMVKLLDPAAKSWIYIKDLYYSIISIISDGIVKPGIWRIGTKKGVTEGDMRTFLFDLAIGARSNLCLVDLPEFDLYAISSFDLASAAEHTLVWYDANRWAWKYV